MPYIGADYVDRADSGGKSLTPPAGASIVVFLLLSFSDMGTPQTLTWRGAAANFLVYNYKSSGGSVAIWVAQAGGGAGTIAWSTPGGDTDCEVVWANSSSIVARDTDTQDVSSNNTCDCDLDTLAGDFCIYAASRNGSFGNTPRGLAVEILDNQYTVSYGIAVDATSMLGAQSGSDYNWAGAAVAFKPPTGRSPSWF